MRKLLFIVLLLTACAAPTVPPPHYQEESESQPKYVRRTVTYQVECIEGYEYIIVFMVSGRLAITDSLDKDRQHKKC